MNHAAAPNLPRRHALRADGLLLLAAVLWGSGFVVQRQISEHLGPLGFNAIRNLIAMAVLLPFVLRRRPVREPDVRSPRSPWLAAGFATGLPLFAGSWVQQAGIARTTAGNAGFITGLYVVLVPLLAALLGHRIHRSTWLAALLATAGMYLLSATDAGHLGTGDLLVLISAGFWAVHVHAVGHFATRLDGLVLTWVQLAVATVLTVPLVPLLEPFSVAALRAVGPLLLYSGVICCAFGFTLQIAGQRHAPPAHAAILMSLESVFAAVFGRLFLAEQLGPRGLAGAALMLAGTLISQWPQLRRRESSDRGA